MNPRSTGRILIPLISFGLGAFTVRQCREQRNPETHSPAHEPSAPAAALPGVQTARTDSASAHEPSREDPPPEKAGPRTIPLTPSTLDAIVIGGQFDQILGRMDLREDQLKAIATLRAGAMEDFKQLEIRHAKVVSKDGKKFVEISAFPEEQDAWLQRLQQSISDTVPDARAEVISRLVAVADNDQQPGKYRREIHVNEPTQGAKIRIEEKTFDSSGQHIDSDYEIVSDLSKNRWGQLLDFSP